MDKRYSDLTNFESQVLSKFLAGDHPALRSLRDQLVWCKVRERELTGVGFFTRLVVPESVASAALESETVRLTDVAAEIEGLGHGAGFVLYVDGGRLASLEGFSYDELWPKVVGSFHLRYIQAERPELAKLLSGGHKTGSQGDAAASTGSE